MSPTKMCQNGHIMDATWDRCPFCPPANGRTPMPRTRTDVPVPVPVPQRPPAPAPAARQTVLREAELAKQKASPVVGWIVVLTGNHRGEDFRIRDGRNSIGSEPGNDIVLTDPHVSARHANIHSTVKDGERVYVVADLDSRNGTFLNKEGKQVFREEIIDSDTLIFGTTVCKFKCI